MTESTNGSGRWILIMVIISVVALALLIMFVLSDNKSEIDGASINAKADRTNPTTTGAAATSEYVDQMSAYAKEKAKVAQETGKTYVSPIIKGAKLRTWEEMTPNDANLKSNKAPEINDTVPVYNPNDDATKAERDKLLLGLVLAWKNEGHVDTVFEIAASESTQESPSSPLNNNLPVNSLAGLVGVGDSFYSTINFNVNTDYSRSGFIISTILSGKLREAEFFGRFKHNRTSRWGESLTIEYDKLVLKDGSVFKIRAIAIDPKTASASLSHDVDHHYAYRWGSLFVGSLLKGWDGFAKATSQSGTQTTAGIGVGGGSVIRSSPEYSVTDRALIGSGEVAKELSTIFRDNFSRPNTVQLFASHMGGKPVSIIVTDIGSNTNDQSRPIMEDKIGAKKNRPENKEFKSQGEFDVYKEDKQDALISPATLSKPKLPVKSDFQ